MSSHTSFRDAAALSDWLAAHHATAKELWVRIYRLDSGVASVTWNDCVVEAIRFGWIDGQKKPLDEQSYLQRLSPRTPGSNWSKKNCAHAEALIGEGRMTAAGLAHVEAAKRDGRWERAYAGSADMEMPEDFLKILDERPGAKRFYATLDRRNRYAIYYRLQTAKKPQTRAKRLADILSMLEDERRFH